MNFRPFRALTVVAAGSLLLALGVASPAAATDYPSWDDVLKARQNQAATAAEVANIEQLLTDLEAKSADLQREAQVKAEAYNVAQAELEAASTKAGRLEQQAQDAADRAALSLKRAGQLVAQFARTGGSSLSVSLLLSPDSGDLLNTLGTMGKLTEQSSLIYRQATVDQNLAQALTDQAHVAETTRKTLQKEAETALDAAQAASDAMLAEVAGQQASADQMYAQLASLKGTTADVEQRYVAGVKASTPPPPPPSHPGSGPGSSLPEVPVGPPSSGAVEGAVAFAYGELGDPYVFGGSGPWGWDCSGLTKAAYASVGVYIGIHSANSQYNYLAGQGKLVPISQIQRGDLLFFSSGGSTGGNKYHTTLYIGGGQMIEAAVPGTNVMVSPIRYGDLVPYAARPTG